MSHGYIPIPDETIQTVNLSWSSILSKIKPIFIYTPGLDDVPVEDIYLCGQPSDQTSDGVLDIKTELQKWCKMILERQHGTLEPVCFGYKDVKQRSSMTTMILSAFVNNCILPPMRIKSCKFDEKINEFRQELTYTMPTMSCILERATQFLITNMFQFVNFSLSNELTNASYYMESEKTLTNVNYLKPMVGMLLDDVFSLAHSSFKSTKKPFFLEVYFVTTDETEKTQTQNIKRYQNITLVVGSGTQKIDITTMETITGEINTDEMYYCIGNIKVVKIKTSAKPKPTMGTGWQNQPKIRSSDERQADDAQMPLPDQNPDTYYIALYCTYLFKIPSTPKK